MAQSNISNDNIATVERDLRRRGLVDIKGFSLETIEQFKNRRRKERKAVRKKQNKAKRTKESQKAAQRTNRPDTLAESKGSTANIVRRKREQSKTILDLIK